MIGRVEEERQEAVGEEVVEEEEGGRKEGRGGCRTVHHPNINKCHRELGFWGSPPRSASACNPVRERVPNAQNTADTRHENKKMNY